MFFVEFLLSRICADAMNGLKELMTNFPYAVKPRLGVTLQTILVKVCFFVMRFQVLLTLTTFDIVDR